ncbi:agmatinase [Hyphobacterium sp. CCMP332]|nr:agmatinase [Hyphobacterium sp. CCMP332]
MKTFAGIPKEYHQLDNAEIVLIPVPYDGTSTWGKGADKGPEAFLEAAENMELFDIQTRTEVYKKGIHLAKAVTENDSPDAMVKAVHNTAKSFLDKGKFVTLFGGEHSISIGSIRAFDEKFDDLTVLQIDAHTDLRPEYQGTPYNHACAVYEASKRNNLIQVGIRSMDIVEMEHLDESKVFWAHEIHKSMDWVNRAIELMTENVFITIDLDAFDPSIMPSTGTPEPGGMNWWQMDYFLSKVINSKSVVGFDIVELAPNKNNRGPDFLSAKLYYKLLSYIYSK